jgi:hypothetical protein
MLPRRCPRSLDKAAMIEIYGRAVRRIQGQVPKNFLPGARAQSSKISRPLYFQSSDRLAPEISPMRPLFRAPRSLRGWVKAASPNMKLQYI